MRDHAWIPGVPSAIVDHWVEVIALMVAHVGRKSREAYRPFTNVMLQASAVSSTFSEVNFDEMVRHSAMPVLAQSSSRLSKPYSPIMPKKVAQLPLPLKPQKLLSPTESRAQKLTARLDALVGRIEQLKGRLDSTTVNASIPQSTNDPLPGTSAASSWEADDLNDGTSDLPLKIVSIKVLQRVKISCSSSGKVSQ